MKSPLLGLQGAVYRRLKDALSCPVYDDVPDGAAMPYVTIGEDTALDWSTKPQPGMEITQTLHVWSAYPGMAEVKRIIDEAIQAVVNTTFDVDGFFVVSAQLDMVDVLRDPEGYRHGVVRFRFKTLEVA